MPIIKDKVRCECGRNDRDRRAEMCWECRAKIRKRVGPRTCYRCKERPATNRSSRPLCDECRGQRQPKTKTCPRCEQIFETRTGERYCRPCAYQKNNFDSCECGTRKDKRAARCKACAGRARSAAGHSSRAGTIGAATRWQQNVRREERISDAAGYVLVLAPDHPKAKGGRVREHVLVMEAHLGRYLRPGENVHHKNGQKADNRPENLELWARHQPIGSRVADQVAWAREILATYGDEF